jgi:hypothetical protein
MASESFSASRWTRENHLFPTVIEVTDQAVIRRKRKFFSKDEISISLAKVASVHIKSGIVWADILIESSARRIRELVVAAQGNFNGPGNLKSA